MKPAFALLLTLTVILPAAAQTPQIVGKARIIDANSIDIAGQRIGLFGIDAPDAEQTCLAAGRRYDCGRNAGFALSQIVGRHWVYCHEKGRDANGAILAVCNLAGAAGPEVNATMVDTGWALADRNVSNTHYPRLEAKARQAKAGLWQGSFVAPWEWRRGKRLSPAPAAAPVRGKAPCLIKGSIDRDGTPVYHMPGGRYYDQTRIDPRTGERWFCSAAQAEEAGWRPYREGAR